MVRNWVGGLLVGFPNMPEHGSINWPDFEQRWHHIVPIVHIEAVDGVGLGLFDLTLKISHAYAWRESCPREAGKKHDS
jgi:hypothetical protein